MLGGQRRTSRHYPGHWNYYSLGRLPRYIKTILIFLPVAALSVDGVLELPSSRVKFPLPLDPGYAKSRKVYFNYTISFPIFVTHGSNQTSVVQRFSLSCKSIAKLE